MSSLLLILGNGYTKRLVAYGLAVRDNRSNVAIEWYNFAREDVNKMPSHSLDPDILSLRNTNYTVFHLSDSCSYYKSKRLKKQEVALRNRWENIISVAEGKDVDMIVLENIDAVLGTGWLNVGDITNMLAKAKSKQIVITGVHLPMDILSAADRVVEVWEREKEDLSD